MTTDPLLLAAKIELDEIDKKLEQLAPLTARRAELIEFLRIGSTVRPFLASVAMNPHALQQMNFKDSVIAASKRMLTGGRWMQTRQIIEELQKQGIQVPGDTDTAKVLRVSGVLHKSEEFIGERGKGWSLRQQQIDHPKSEAKSVRAPLASVTA